MSFTPFPSNCEYCGVPFKGNGGPCIVTPFGPSGAGRPVLWAEAHLQRYLCGTCADLHRAHEVGYAPTEKAIADAYCTRQSTTAEQLLAVLAEVRLVGLPRHTLECLWQPRRLTAQFGECCDFARAWMCCHEIELELRSRGVLVAMGAE